MDPRVLEGEDYSHNVDIWSVGCIIYKLLFGTNPFPFRDAPSLKKKIAKGKIEFPSDIKIAI